MPPVIVRRTWPSRIFRFAAAVVGFIAVTLAASWVKNA